MEVTVRGLLVRTSAGLSSVFRFVVSMRQRTALISLGSVQNGHKKAAAHTGQPLFRIQRNGFQGTTRKHPPAQLLGAAVCSGVARLGTALFSFAGGHGESADGNDGEQDDVFHSVVVFWYLI